MSFLFVCFLGVQLTIAARFFIISIAAVMFNDTVLETWRKGEICRIPALVI